MKTIIPIILIMLATTGQAALWSFKVPLDGLTSNGVPVATLTNALAPSFSPASGAVPLSVTVTSAGNLIYYTTNNDTPTTNLAGVPSGTEILVTSTNQPLKALAWFADGYRNPSTVTSASYTNAIASADTIWISQTNYAYVGGLSTYNDGQLWQGVSNSTDQTISISSVDLYGSQWFSITNAQTFVWFTTGTNATGTPLGGYSTTNAVTSSNTMVWNEGFDFVNPPSISAHTLVYFNVSIVNDVQFNLGASHDNPLPGFGIWMSKNTNWVDELYDATFKIYTNAPPE